MNVDDMRPRVEQVLRKRFTRFDGWDLKENSKGDPDLVFEMEYKKKVLRALCNVSTGAVTSSLLNRLNRQAETLSAPGVEIIAKIIAIPRGIAIPAEIRRRLQEAHIELLTIEDDISSK